MNNAPLYQTANEVQRNDARKILNEYRDILQWRPDGQDSVIDIGCGSGDVTIDFILPLLPKNYKRLIGVDVSEKMIEHAAINYKNPRIGFEVMDISCTDVKMDFKFKFDHVISLYCLHWVQNQRKALENIFNLLTPTGDCLLVFLANNPVFDAYKKLSENNKWSPYMKDVNKFIAPLHYSKDAGAEFSELLREVGFYDLRVKVRNEIFYYYGTENLKNNVRAVSPFIERLPNNMQENFLEDYIKVVTEMQLREEVTGTSLSISFDYQYRTPYKLIVAYARKPNLNSGFFSVSL